MSQYNIIDNLVVDTETGEVLGNAITEGVIDSHSSLEAVLEKIGEVEARLAAQQLRHQAILENCRKLEVKTASYLAYLKGIYNAPIEAYAKTRLEGQKSKTLTTPYGSVSFRTVKGGLKVVDPNLALDYAQLNGFTNAIKVSESFQISKLDPAQRELIESKLPEGFEMVADKETMSIKVMA
jgi:hypothetical protein